MPLPMHEADGLLGQHTSVRENPVFNDQKLKLKEFGDEVMPLMRQHGFGTDRTARSPATARYEPSGERPRGAGEGVA